PTIRRVGRVALLRAGAVGQRPASGRSDRQNPQGCQARRSARRAAYQVRAGDQSQDGQGSRLDDSAITTRASRRDHPKMDRRTFPCGIAGTLVLPLMAEAQQAKVYKIGLFLLRRVRM